MRTIANPEKFRTNIRGKLNDIIGNEKYSKNLEIGVYNYTLKEATNRKVVKKWDNPFYVQLYLDRLRSIINNLNAKTLELIKKGDIKAPVLAFMTHQEMNYERWYALIQTKIKRDKTYISSLKCLILDVWLLCKTGITMEQIGKQIVG